jgi:hypothetical protein
MEITYPSRLVFYINSTVNIQPTITGSESGSFSVIPDLPVGLSLNPNTGILSGIPTFATASTDYTIRYNSIRINVNIQIKGVSASRVYGQKGSFTSGTANNDGISADSLNSPRGCSLDRNDNLYIADTNNHRVLFYPNGSTTATRVYGQNGSFTTNTSNNGGISPNSLNSPRAVYIDRNDILYITDTSNDRVLVYENGSTTASRVYGKLGDFTDGTANFGGLSASSLNQPRYVTQDKKNLLYINDTNNHRILSYQGQSTTANIVYGQDGSFLTNSSGVSATQFTSPFSAAFDSQNNLYVADYDNHRILFFTEGSTTASRVYGQNGSFTSNVVNLGGVSATSFDSIIGVNVDSSNGLFAADLSNNRLLYFPSGSTTASIVFGQNGSFTSNTANNGGISANSLDNPRGVCLDSMGAIYILDDDNNRVLYY